MIFEEACVFQINHACMISDEPCVYDCMISDEPCGYDCMISDEVDGGGAGLLPGGGDEPPLRQGSVQTRQGPGETRQQEGVSGG